MSSHVFGPVPSRRLGRSLGVDLVPYKTCTYDCVYCQIGRTTCLTAERKERVPTQEILSALRGKLASSPDYITLSGSGEPTLHSKLGELIAGIKALTDTPVAVLTNGSLLWRPEVREGLLQADLVAPSLDAPDERLFRQVNRPHESIAFDKMVEGLIAFREAFSGQFWLEVFLLDDVTGTPEAVSKLAELTRRIGPDRAQLNTVTRPPAEASATAVSEEDMSRFAEEFGDVAEVIAEYRRPASHGFEARREDVLETLRRRPCTIEDVARGMGLHPNEAVKYVSQLFEQGALRREDRGGKVYYSAAGDA